jgi:ABC-type transporter Mla subunit MlaD
MPRVYSPKKNRSGKSLACGRCSRTIEPGETYYWWKFRYGGKQVRCGDHYPRPSELTQSKLSQVYAAVEGAEDALGDAKTVDEVTGALETAAGEVRDVADEYREAAEAMGDAGSEHEERADAVEEFADALEQFDPDLDDEPEEDESEEEAQARVLEEAREQASEVLGELSV